MTPDRFRGWFRKILFLLTLPPIHVSLADTRGLATRTRDRVHSASSISPAMPKLFCSRNSSSFNYPRPGAQCARCWGFKIQSITHTLKEAVPGKVRGAHHLHQLSPTPPNKSHYCLMTQTRHKVCAPPAKVGSVCTNSASRQVLSSLSTLQPLSSASELWSHQAAEDRLPDRPR